MSKPHDRNAGKGWLEHLIQNVSTGVLTESELVELFGTIDCMRDGKLILHCNDPRFGRSWLERESKLLKFHLIYQGFSERDEIYDGGNSPVNAEYVEPPPTWQLLGSLLPDWKPVSLYPIIPPRGTSCDLTSPEYHGARPPGREYYRPGGCQSFKKLEAYLAAGASSYRSDEVYWMIFEFDLT